VSCRGFAEGDHNNPSDAASLAKRSREWLDTIGLGQELSPWERQILDAPLGTLSERDRVNASWLSEAVVVLAWALGKSKLPGYEDQCDPAGAANSLGFLQPIKKTALDRPQLQKTGALREYNEFIYNLHWRIRDFSLNRKSYDFEKLARKAWGEPLERHGIKLKNKDLCVRGVPISHAAEADWRQLASITQERHRASNWLVGYASEDFYEVTTDT
jgi:hypothetical protein